ncbi:MAG: hypothetical protein ACLUKN_13365 [Bacilli bacterium]
MSIIGPTPYCGCKLQGFGLLVIDEEHRFGGKHKEKIKRMREDIDVLQ